jgi:hypothetical protein
MNSSDDLLILTRNEVVKLRGRTLRILQITEDQGTFVIDMQQRTALPEWIAFDAFQSAAEDGALLQLPIPEADRPLVDLASDVAVRDRRWNRIAELTGAENASKLLTPGSRGQLLRKHAIKVHTSKETLLSDLRLYWRGGQTKDALLGGYFNCGALDPVADDVLRLDVETGTQTVKVLFSAHKGTAAGRPPKDDRYKIFKPSKELLKAMLEIATSYYKKDETRTVRATATHVARILFCAKDSEGRPIRLPKGRMKLLPLGRRPSPAQIRRLIRKALPKARSYQLRVGESDFENNHAAASGSVQDDTRGPGDVYEIDATLLDVWIVARDDRTVIIGKPILYLIIDRDSRLIVGFHLTLDNPSWEGAKQAVLSICGNWESLCKHLGIPYDPKDWPAAGALPNRFFADRGEGLTYESDSLCDGLNVDVTNPPSKKARAKCIVECGFFTTQIPLKDDATGYEPPSNARKRRGKKYCRDACLTLDELAADLLRIVIAHNWKPLPGYPSPPEDILAGRQPIPVALYTRGVRRRMGYRARFPQAYLLRKLLPTGEATVWQDGIHFGGLIYTFESPLCDDWQAAASLQGEFKVQARYDRNLCDDIAVLDPGGKTEFLGTLVSADKHYTGLSFAEVEFIKKQQALLDRDAEETREEFRAGIGADIEEASARAYAEMKASTTGMPLLTRFRHADIVRSAEADDRRREVHTGAVSTSVATTTRSKAPNLPAQAGISLSGGDHSPATEQPPVPSEEDFLTTDEAPTPSLVGPGLVGDYFERLRARLGEANAPSEEPAR